MKPLAGARAEFNEQIAPRLAAQVGVPHPWDGSGSRRFAYFSDKSRFAVVAGPQEGANVDLALVYGLEYRSGRRLELVLPSGYAFPTRQRSAWLTDEARPFLHEHDGNVVQECRVPTRVQTIDELSARLKPGQTLQEELRVAATPVHLGERDADVFELVEWATKHPHLDPGHRKGERVWHCMGQKVLTVKGTPGGLRVTAGIHVSGYAAAEPHSVPSGERLLGDALARIQRAVEAGIEARLSGDYKRADEHWMQAVIRREPTLLGVEHPALRELPAWRPVAAGPGESKWRRGFIDLVGVDAHGDLRVVETKLASNPDDLLMFQGIDYYIWARAYEGVLRDRLGAPKKSGIILHYVVGATREGSVHLSKYVPAQAQALSPEIPWRFQTVVNWYQPPPDTTTRIRSELLGPGEIPTGN